MVKTKYISIYLFIFLINICFISSIIEIPLYPIKVKGIPKYENISMMEQYYPDENESISFAAKEGNTFLNRDILFIAKIKIGSQKQIFNLLLDTGSSILWVGRNTCGGNNKIINKFNPSTSSTAKQTIDTFSIQYGSGSCSGYYYLDNIVYISDKDFAMKFGVADTANFIVDQCDGIIGLSKEYKYNELSFIHMLKEKEITDSLSFSVKFDSDIIKPNIEGTMYIGKHDDFSKSETISLSLVTFSTANIFWACTLNSFGFQNSDNYIYKNYDINIIFDTGTNSIILPFEYLEGIISDLAKFNCQVVQVGSVYQIMLQSVSNLPDLIFKFGRHTLTIPGSYGFYRSSSGIYSFVIFQQSEVFIMGSPFFFVFHTLFDSENKELKIYPLKNTIKSGLSTVVIVLIIIGCIVLIILIILIIHFSVKKCRQRKNMEVSPEEFRTNYFENLYKT